MSPTPTEPQVASALINALRRRLILDGSWPELEAAILAKEPALTDWLREADSEEWLAMEGYLRFLQRLLDEIGEERARELGAQRLRDDLEAGPLGPMLRGWLREFAADATALLRVAPYAWQAVTRGAGRMVLDTAEAGHIVFRVEGAPPALLSLRGWPTMLVGFAGALLEVSGRQGSFDIGPDPDGVSLRLEGTWSEPG